MDANIITAIFGLVGTAIGGIITYAVTYLSNKFQMQMQQEQWKRDNELEKLRLEQDQKRQDEEQKRQKEKEFHEIISQCIMLLPLHIRDIDKRHQGSLPNSYSYINECVKWTTEFSLYPIEKDERLQRYLESFIENPFDVEKSRLLLLDIINFSKTISQK